MYRDYTDSLSRDPETLPRYFITGNAGTMVSNRISHFFNLRGPSVTIDTACSTTLTALHLACQSLRAGESEMAIVVGANLLLNSDVFVAMSNLGFLSPDGISYAFDARAAGYGRGDGVAAIVLKALPAALRTQDPIRAVIRETALNQDGRTSTITAPSNEAQERLIRECYRKAGLDMSQTSYIEAHGTGTATGDPLEVSAISAAFDGHALQMGSIKANIGHTEAASGIAGIIKVVIGAFHLFMVVWKLIWNANCTGLVTGKGADTTKCAVPTTRQHTQAQREKHQGLLSPPLHQISPAINAAKLPKFVQDWPLKDGIRRASVNNFGFGGSNAHAILEWYDPATALNGNGSNGDQGRQLHRGIMQARIYTLSAKDEQACQSMISNLRDYVSDYRGGDEQGFLDNLAYTLGSRRSILPWTASCAAESLRGLISALESGRLSPKKTGEKIRLGWVFTGQGAQWHAMGRELLGAFPVFREAILSCDEYIKEMGSTWAIMGK